MIARLYCSASSRTRFLVSPGIRAPPGVAEAGDSTQALICQRFNTSSKPSTSIPVAIEGINKKIRSKNISSSTADYEYRLYFEAWRQKVERIGALNYPEAAKAGIFGALRLTVSLSQTGKIEDIIINKSSGNTGLDEAANFKNTDFKIFGKPTTRKYRRMAVALAYGSETTTELVEKAKKVAIKIKVG